MKRLGYVVVVAWSLMAVAKVEMPTYFQDHMVLQRESQFPVFGLANPSERITVTLGDLKWETEADAAGRWLVTLADLPACTTPRTLTIAGTNQIVLTDVLVGDVWICSGQSNMEYSMGWRPLEWEKFQAESVKFPTIRAVKIPHGDDPFQSADSIWNPQFLPTGRRAPKWHGMEGKDFIHTTAVGYFFARRLTLETGLPIGLVDASWSAQKIEPFIPQDVIMSLDHPLAGKLKALYPSTPEGQATCEKYLAELRAWGEAVKQAAAEGGARPERPEYPALTDWQQLWGTHYNRMIHPLTHFPVKGVIWYQGCANAADGLGYLTYIEALVDGWRKAWKQPELPFYSVQLASFWNCWRRVDSIEGGDGFTPVREAQRLSMKIPHTGVAVTLDLGEAYEIHPHEKLHVGERLARWALRNEYGRKDLIPSGPDYARQTIEGNRIRLHFNWVGGGLMIGEKSNADNRDPVEAPAGTPLKGFAIQAADKTWHNAEAVIDGETVVVSSPEVVDPIAVRYAYHGSVIGNANLYNRDGLPAPSFKTDL